MANLTAHQKLPRKHDLRQRPDFETSPEAKRRGEHNAHRLEPGDRQCRRLARKLKRCRKGRRCGSWACDVCKRRTRLWFGEAAGELFGDVSTLAVTVALAGCSLPAGSLLQADVAKLRDMVRK